MCLYDSYTPKKMKKVLINKNKKINFNLNVNDKKCEKLLQEKLFLYLIKLNFGNILVNK